MGLPQNYTADPIDVLHDYIQQVGDDKEKLRAAVLLAEHRQLALGLDDHLPATSENNRRAMMTLLASTEWRLKCTAKPKAEPSERILVNPDTTPPVPHA